MCSKHSCIAGSPARRERATFILQKRVSEMKCLSSVREYARPKTTARQHEFLDWDSFLQDLGAIVAGTLCKVNVPTGSWRPGIFELVAAGLSCNGKWNQNTVRPKLKPSQMLIIRSMATRIVFVVLSLEVSQV